MVDLGVLPTPGVAHLSKADGVAAAMISASHNPFGDNGIKFFAPGGRKLDDPTEDALEAQLARLEREGIPGARRAARSAAASASSTATRRPASATPATSQQTSIDGRRLAGLRVVLDCSNGAASVVGPQVLTALGAEVTVIHAEPDGVEHQRRLRLEPPRVAAAASWPTAGPTSASRSTATPTGSSPSTPTATSSTATT